MSYLTYVAMFGAAATIFLWLRDARIFFRTGLPGYRKAAYWGVAYGALATLGVFFTIYLLELLGLGLILGALYLQGRIEREKVWGSSEGKLQRLLGSVPIRRANKK
ncbi:MAG TPA: ABC transporter permease [Methanoregula sp.]|nr:ABC transporter permease [Methanoregula sp.]HUT38282.1 ABC transporter permease [Methanoregula sp.]